MVCGFNPMEGLWILAQLFEKSRGWVWVLTMNGLRHIRSGITNKHDVNFWKKHVNLFSQEEFARECIPWREYLDVAICKCYWLTFKSEIQSRILLGGKEIDARTWKNCSSALDVLLYRCIPTVLDICMIMIDYDWLWIYTYIYRLFDDIWCIVKYGSIYIFLYTYTHTHTHIYICIHVHIFLHKLICIYCTHTHQIFFLWWSSVPGGDLYGPGLGKHQLFGVSAEQDPGRRCTMLHDVARHWTCCASCCAGCTSCPCKSLRGIQSYVFLWKNSRVKPAGRSCTMLHWH